MIIFCIFCVRNGNKVRQLISCRPNCPYFWRLGLWEQDKVVIDVSIPTQSMMYVRTDGHVPSNIPFRCLEIKRYVHVSKLRLLCDCVTSYKFQKLKYIYFQSVPSSLVFFHRCLCQCPCFDFVFIFCCSGNFSRIYIYSLISKKCSLKCFFWHYF